MFKVLISFIVPVYNVEEYLARCIDSILKIKKFEYEILLINDGSTDDSGLICNKYSNLHNNIKNYYKVNGGLSSARNFGINHSNGKYIVFVDSDDYINSSFFDEICDFLTFENKYDILTTNLHIIFSDNERLIEYRKINNCVSGEEYLEYQHKYSSMISSVVQNIYMSSFIRDNSLYFKEGIFHEDEEFTPRAFLLASNVYQFYNHFYNYEIRSNSIMTTSNHDKHFYDFSLIVKSLNEYYDNFNFKDKYLKKLLINDLIDKYMSLFVKTSFYSIKKEYKINSLKILKMSYKFKTKIKAIIFITSKHLFKFVSYLKG